MDLQFYKYQGTGNDFVMIDDRNGLFDADNHELIALLCNRRFGVGSDGLILLQQVDGYDFRMVYFNADGYEGSMCGNGGRCTVAFAYDLGIFTTETSFIAVDGPHEATRHTDGIIDLKMIDLDTFNKDGEAYFMNTGSPHHVDFVDDLTKFDVIGTGSAIRNDLKRYPEGTNVNFVETLTNGIEVATYERGVEDETLSCGTGVTASCIAFHQTYMLGTAGKNIEIPVVVKGGQLKVKFDTADNKYSNIWLCGPALRVFEGTFKI